MKHVHIGSGDAFKVVAGSSRAQAAVMVLGPGESTGGPDNRHEGSDQWLFVIAGQGKAVVEGEAVALSARSLLLIEAQEAHEIINTGEAPLETLNLYAPPEY